MRSILFIMVIFLAALVFLTNSNNPWQEEISLRLKALFGKEEEISEVDVTEEGANREVYVIQPMPSQMEPLVERERGRESRSEGRLFRFVAEEKEASEELRVSEIQQKESSAPAQMEPDPKRDAKKEERLTAQDVRSLMEILDNARRKLLGYGEKKESAAQRQDLNSEERDSIKQRLVDVAGKLGLEPKLALAMAEVESAFDPKAVSPKGAVGVLQVMPGTAWEHFGVSREVLFDPEVNIRVGLSWMKSLLDRFDQDLDLSLAAYNAGAQRVIEAGNRIPPITETREYVRKVKTSMETGGS